MKDLLEALTIFTSERRPTCCEHDILYVLVNPADVTAEDRERLEQLGFHAEERDQNFYSNRFGSA